MGAGLDGAKTKIQWAEKHFGDFKDIVFGPSTGVDTRKTTVIHYNLQGQLMTRRSGDRPSTPRLVATTGLMRTYLPREATFFPLGFQ